MTELRRVSKRFGPVTAIRDLSLNIEEGQRLAVVGDSGAGKTTLLRLIAGLERPDTGSVLVNGREVSAVAPHMRDLAIMFQSPALWPHMTLMANALFGAPANSEERVQGLFQAVGIGGIADRLPQEVSGGQAQRASLVRALAARKRTVLLDEPLTGVDMVTQEKMVALIDRCIGEDGATLVTASHDGSVAERLGANVFQLPLSAEDWTG